MAYFSPRGYKNPATVGEINDPGFWQTVGENQDARFLEAKEAADLVSGEAAAATAKANEAKAVADFAGQRAAGAVATAIDARDAAQGAVDTADNAADRVDALEVMGGVEPGSVNDAEMKLHAEQDGGLFNTALKAQIDDAKPGGTDFVAAVEAGITPGMLRVRRTMTPIAEVQADLAGGVSVSHRINGALDAYRVYSNTTLTAASGEAGTAVEGHALVEATLTGSWSPATNNVTRYATTPGATFEMTVNTGDSGTLDLNTYIDDRGGMWSITVDGGTPVEVSAWNATAVSAGRTTRIATGLSAGDHVVVGTFTGDDPANPPSTGAGTARGWVSKHNWSTGDGRYLITATSDRSSTIVVTELVPGSNKEFAIALAPADMPEADVNFVPQHSGIATAFEASPPRYYLDGAVIDWDDIPLGSSASVDGQSFQVVQHIYGRHPSKLGVDLIDVRTVTTFHATGKVSLTGRVEVLQPIRVGGAYLAMGPVTGSDLFDSILTSAGTQVANAAGQVGTITYLPGEGDTTTSFAATASTRPDIIAAFSIYDPKNSRRIGRDHRPPEDQRLMIDHRTTALAKVYPFIYASGDTIPAGEVVRWEAAWLYSHAPGARTLFGA